MRTVSEVAALSGVTVRALHHYDEIGLLVPSARSEAGYRQYGHDDLARLQEILGWRALGFPLGEIGALIDGSGGERGLRLRDQRLLVDHELGRLGAVARALDAAIASLDDGLPQPEETMFDGLQPAEYEAEARERWGDTEAHRESTRRVAGYGDREWAAIRAEADAIVSDFVTLMSAGGDASGAEPRAVAERHRQHIIRWFYPCPPEMHRRLGEMYVADERFARNYERHADGLAVFVRDAIAANAQGPQKATM